MTTDVIDANTPAVYLGDKLLYRPQPKQLEFHTNPAKYLLMGGSRGGGKTFSAIWEAIFTCLLVPGCDVLILRRTLPQLKKTVISEFMKIPHQVYSKNPKAYNRSDNCVYFDNGSKIWFGSCRSEDDARQFLGSQFLLIIFEEFSEFTFSIFEQLKGCNRCPIKFDTNGRAVTPKMRMTTNPGGPMHAGIKKMWMEGKPAPGQEPSTYDKDEYSFIRSTVFDNKYYAEDEAYLSSLRSLSPRLRAAYLDGSWDIFEGQAFPMFDSARSTVSIDDALLLRSKQPWQPRWISIDHGFEHSCVVLWYTKVEMWTKSGEKRTHILCYRELEVNHMVEAAIAQQVIALNNKEKIDRIYLSPECFGDNTHKNTRAKVMGDMFVLGKLPRPSKADNDRVGGWALMRSMISGDEPYSEFLISEECTGLIESIPLLLIKSGTEDVKKQTTKADDFGDSCRYGLKSHLAPRGDTPEDILRAEKLAPHIESGNYTQAYLTYLQFEDLRKQQTKVFSPKRRRRH